MGNKKFLHTSAFFTAKLATAFAVAGVLVACGDSETICEEPIEIVDSSSSSSDVIESSSFKETDSTSSSSRQAQSSTPHNDTLSSSIVAQESSSSAKADQGNHDDSTAVSSSSSLAVPSSSSAIPGSSSESPYLWSDEFDGSAIDTSKWTFEIGTGSSGWGNNEKEYYTGPRLCRR